MCAFYSGQRVWVEFWNKKKFGIIINSGSNATFVQFDDVDHPTRFIPEEYLHLHVFDKEINNITYYKQNYVTSLDDCLYLSINPEYIMQDRKLTSTGNFYAYCVHRFHGSCVFSLHRNRLQEWESTDVPGFIGYETITDIGDEIEAYYPPFPDSTNCKDISIH